MHCRRGWWVAIAGAIGCAAPTHDSGDDLATGDASSAASGDEAVGDTSVSDATASSSATASSGEADADASSGATLPDVPDGDSGVFATGSFVIPAGTVVEEFTFAGTTDFVPGGLDGRTIVVAIADVSHPERDQDALCPGSHPLDGCATVDYGAFGSTHDNRIAFEGEGGPITIHLHKDRSLQPEPEPLPVSE